MVFLAVARLIIIVFPFKIIARYIGQKCAADFNMQDIKPQQMNHRITRSVERAVKFSPWRTKCLEQALAARIMLGLRGKSYVFF